MSRPVTWEIVLEDLKRDESGCMQEIYGGRINANEIPSFLTNSYYFKVATQVSPHYKANLKAPQYPQG